MPDQKLTQLASLATVTSGVHMYAVGTDNASYEVPVKVLDAFLTGRSWASGRFDKLYNLNGSLIFDLIVGKIYDTGSQYRFLADSNNTQLRGPAGTLLFDYDNTLTQISNDGGSTAIIIGDGASTIDLITEGLTSLSIGGSTLTYRDSLTSTNRLLVTSTGFKILDSGSKERIIVGSNTDLRNDTGALMGQIGRNFISLSNLNAVGTGIQSNLIKVDNQNVGLYTFSGGIVSTLGTSIKVHDGFNNNRILSNTAGTTISDTNSAGSKIDKFLTNSTGTFIYDASGNLRLAASNPSTTIYHYSQKPALIADVGTIKLVDFANSRNRVLANTTGVFLYDAAGRQRLKLDSSGTTIVSHQNINVLKSDGSNIILYTPSANEAFEASNNITTLRAGGIDLIKLDIDTATYLYNNNGLQVFFADGAETSLYDKDSNKRIQILTGNLTIYNKNSQIRLVSEHNNTVINSNLNVSGQIFESGRRPLFVGVTGISITGGNSFTGRKIFTGNNISIIESGNFVYFNPATVTGVLTPWNSDVNAAGYSLTNVNTGYFNKVRLNSAGTTYEILSDVDTFTIQNSVGGDVFTHDSANNLVKIYNNGVLTYQDDTESNNKTTIGDINNTFGNNSPTLTVGYGFNQASYFSSSNNASRLGINTSSPLKEFHVIGDSITSKTGYMGYMVLTGVAFNLINAPLNQAIEYLLVSGSQRQIRFNYNTGGTQYTGAINLI